ncbi:MAG TPA: helix-turn-helix transcriptional regulator [Candidatus Onthovicinus excrementipullorum]|nr:helix-turn-helix transcriptional regulator [Candidatus Onthovicinus excrementipullorum]
MIGERLAEVRKDHRDTQADLAERLGVSLPAVRAWEQGKSSPSHEMLVEICRLYGISADFLLGLSDIDPVYERRRAAERLTQTEQTALRDFETYLLWRRKHLSKVSKTQVK